MKSSIKPGLILAVVLAALSFRHAEAQTLLNLHNFAGVPNDGSNPSGGLILSGDTLYGTASGGGSSNGGTIFAIQADSTGFTNLHHSLPSEGWVLYGGLVISSNVLFGTTALGGSSGNGTVFAVHTDGTGFAVLHNFTEIPLIDPFTNSDGATPRSELIVSGGTLYGTAAAGGIAGSGTVFALSTNGSGFTNLHSFAAFSSSPPYTNSDGAFLLTGLILSSNVLYGTAYYGGSSGNGTVFKVNTDGSGFTTLHHFTPLIGFDPSTNGDGANPSSKLLLAGDTLFGTASAGGSSGSGTLFTVKTDGTGFTNLHNFTALPQFPGPYTNSDGFNPTGGLILSGTNLYGATQGGGSLENGTIFSVNTNGANFICLYNFSATPSPASTNSDGIAPNGGLILADGILYGTAGSGGSSGYGTVFGLSLGPVNAPRLTIVSSVENVVLSWPWNAAGFTLQSTTNLVSPAAWSTVSPPPVITNGRNAVTNPISGTQKFYRLSQ